MNSYFRSNHFNVNRLPFQTTSPKPSQELEPEEEEIPDTSEDALQAINPEDLAHDRGWLYRCRACDLHTRVNSKVPNCRHCGFTQTMRGAL